MKKYIFYFIAGIIAGCMASCSSDDEPGKIELAKDQSSEVTVYAGQTGGEINFTAAAAWSAHVSDAYRAWSDIDWISLDSTTGSAGDVTLSFTLSENRTGALRSAYIIILCENERISIKITQTTEDSDDDGDEPEKVDPLSLLHANLDALSRGGYRMGDFDGNLFAYNDSRYGLVSRITGNLGACTFDYSNAPKQIIAETTLGKRYVMTLNGDGFASHIECWENNVLESSYDLEYNSGRLVKFIQYESGNVCEVSELTWNSDYDISEVKTCWNGGETIMTPEYSSMTNDHMLMLFDTQLWIDMDEMEVFYYCGLFGFATRHLIVSTSATEVEGGDTYRFSSKFDYSFDGNNCPVKMIYTETEEGEGISSDVMDFTWVRKN